MRKIYLQFLFLGFATALCAQKIEWSSINKPNINLRGAPVVVGQLSIQAPAPGKVILRFDGHCLSTAGDRIVLAASQTANWSDNDGCVEVEAASADINSNAFSHTRAYDVAAGNHTFYAVAQNFYETAGDGMASVFGSLTAEWFPADQPGKAFARHKGIALEDIFVEGASVAFTQIEIDAPTAGRVLARFDGKCVSSNGDLLFFAASDAPVIPENDGSASCEVISNDFNRFSFAHVRSYQVAPGKHTFYAMVENAHEIYGTGFISLFGSLTLQFYPDGDASAPVFQPVTTPFGVSIEGPPAVVGQMALEAPVAGKLLLNFAGTCIASAGDQVRLAANTAPNWSANDGNLTYEPYSSERNRVSFSHTRAYALGPGKHDCYAVIQNHEEFEGSGLAVVYASFTARFVPDENVAAEEPKNLFLQISPNPVSNMLTLECPGERLALTLHDGQGRVVRQAYKTADAAIQWDIADLPNGVYFVRAVSDTGSVLQKVLKI